MARNALCQAMECPLLRSKPSSRDSHRSRDSHTSYDSGFTLIEVLVALAIVTIALAAVARASGQLTLQQERLGQQQIASVCADNAFAELRLSEPFPAAGERQLSCTQLGITLTATMSILPTPNPNFRRLQTTWRNAEGEPLITLTAIAASNTQ
jgi:general secretion pathway protein I